MKYIVLAIIGIILSLSLLIFSIIMLIRKKKQNKIIKEDNNGTI